MAEKKHSVMALLEILKKYSDMDHVLTLKEIQNHLQNEYDTVLDRRTIYTNLDILEDFGYQISDYEDNGRGYYLAERQFDKGEILLLANAVHASHFISSGQSDQLIGKLLDTQSRYDKADFRDKVFMPNPVKSVNKQLLYNLETVSEAIRDARVLQFRYMRYDSRKKAVPRREEPYIVEPRYIVYADARPYMIVTSENHPGFIHYRIDRMADARILNDKARPLPKRTDPYDYARNKLFMYSGETETVTYRCRNEVMDHMIDIFGPELAVLPDREESFLIKVKVPAQGAMYLAQQFMDSLTIIEPEELKEEFKKKLKETRKRYE